MKLCGLFPKNYDFAKTGGLILLFLVLQLPSLVTLAKYSFICLIPFYLFVVSVCYIYLWRIEASQIKILASPFLFFLLCIALIVINIILYHYELQLQALGRGSDWSNALILSGTRLLHGEYPYALPTYLHNPLSPGPGWVILLLPFACSGGYALLVPAFIIVSAIVIQRLTKSIFYANRYLLNLFLSAAFWQLSGAGSDYMAIGAVYALISIVIFYDKKNGWRRQILWMTIVGMLATARINFVYFGPLLGIFMAKKDFKKGWVFAIVSLLVTLILHLGFGGWHLHSYAPWNVVHDKASIILNKAGLSILLIGCMTMLFSWRYLSDNVANWLLLLWYWLTLPLGVIICSAFMQSTWELKQCEELSYVLITAPILLMAISLAR